jgi:hypothetical protein
MVCAWTREIGFTWFDWRMPGLGTVADRIPSSSGAISPGTRTGDVAPDGAKIIIRIWNYKYFAPDGAGEGRRLGLIWDWQRFAHCDSDAFGFTWFDRTSVWQASLGPAMGPSIDLQ